MVIIMNATLILNITSSQSEELGSIQLEVIRGDLQDTISAAEEDLLHVALRTEQLLDAGGSRSELAKYFDAQRESMLADESFMNVYVAGGDWHIIPGFDAPPDFHATERVWYVGAVENPGEVYVSEPYQDADTGSMCFTVSTLLLDGETVVGMDLNLSKVQESILRMTTDKDQTAMIVTSSGLIVGYTNSSLIGTRADQKLPEFSNIIDRVTTSHEHASFTAQLDGRPCVVFSSETNNH